MNLGIWIAIGVAIGAAIGAAVNQTAMGVAFGAAFGTALTDFLADVFAARRFRSDRPQDAVFAAIALFFMMSSTLKGFEIRVAGQAPRAARFAGFSEKRTVMFCFLLSGGLAGLAGATEVAGVITQLQPQVSPGYGFTAIIVAFLGRLNPIGVIFAGLLLALSYIPALTLY